MVTVTCPPAAESAQVDEPSPVCSSPRLTLRPTATSASARVTAGQAETALAAAGRRSGTGREFASTRNRIRHKVAARESITWLALRQNPFHLHSAVPSPDGQF